VINKIKALKNHTGFRRYGANTVWLFGEKILRMIVGLFVGVWVARYLGPQQFGLLSYAQSFVGLFAAVATLGLDGIVIRELVKNESRRNELLGTAFLLKFMGAISIFILLAVAVNFTSNDSYTNTLVFIIASATIFQSFNVIDFYFQSQVISKYIVYANVITLSVSSIIKILFIVNSAPLIAFVWLIVFDSFVTSLGFIYFYFNSQLSLKDWKFDKEIAKHFIHDSWPLIISGMAVMIYARIDQIMLKEMVGFNEVGQFSVAIRTIEIFDFLSLIVVSSLAPAITKAKSVGEELYFHRLAVVYKFMMVIFLLVFIPIYFFGDKLILLLYGDQYKIAAELFVLSAFRTLFTNFGVARSLFINNNNFFKYSMIITILGACMNILLNLYLIPLYQAYGALLSTIISFTFTIFIFNFIFKELRFNGWLMIKSIFTFYTLKMKDLK